MFFNKQICSFLSRFVYTLSALVTSDFSLGKRKKTQQNQQPTLLKTQEAKLAMSLKYGMNEKKYKKKISIQYKLGSDGTRTFLLRLSPVTILLSVALSILL